MTALSQRRNSKLLFLPGKMLLQCLWLTTFLIHNYMYVMAVQQTSDNGLDDVIESLKEGNCSFPVYINNFKVQSIAESYFRSNMFTTIYHKIIICPFLEFIG